MSSRYQKKQKPDIDRDTVLRCVDASIRRWSPKGMERSTVIGQDTMNYLFSVIELRARQIIKKTTDITPSADDTLPLTEDLTFVHPEDVVFLRKLRAAFAKDVTFEEVRDAATSLTYTEVFYLVARNSGALSEDCIKDLEANVDIEKKTYRTRGARALYDCIQDLLRLPQYKTSTVTAYDVIKALSTEAGTHSGCFTRLTDHAETFNNPPRERAPAPLYLPLMNSQDKD